MVEHELLWAMLPEGLVEYFDIKEFKKEVNRFQITLEEKNTLGELPEEYRGKKIINTVLRELTIADFPIRGRKTEVLIKRRYWKMEGVVKWYMRPIDIRSNGTMIEKEFAIFLKEFNRIFPHSDLTSQFVDEVELQKLRTTVQKTSE